MHKYKVNSFISFVAETNYTKLVWLCGICLIVRKIAVLRTKLCSRIIAQFHDPKLKSSKRPAIKLRLQAVPLPHKAYVKKVQVAHTRLPSVGFRSWSQFLAVSLQVPWVINRTVGCHYFPLGLQLPPATLKRAATSFVARWTEALRVWAVCLRLLPDSVAAAIWTRALLRLSPTC